MHSKFAVANNYLIEHYYFSILSKPYCLKVKFTL